jgi:hypothetical protein
MEQTRRPKLFQAEHIVAISASVALFHAHDLTLTRPEASVFPRFNVGRCQRLSLGRTALEPKAALGAKPEPMRVWLRHRVPTLNWMVRGLLGTVPRGEAPERSPFKARARDGVTEGAGPVVTSI